METGEKDDSERSVHEGEADFKGLVSRASKNPGARFTSGGDSADAGTFSPDGKGSQIDSSAVFVEEGQNPTVSVLWRAPATGSSVEPAEVTVLGGENIATSL